MFDKISPTIQYLREYNPFYDELKNYIKRKKNNIFYKRAASTVVAGYNIARTVYLKFTEYKDWYQIYTIVYYQYTAK